MMSSAFIRWPEITPTILLDLVGIFVVVLLLNRFLRVMTRLLIKPAASQSRAAQTREQQTRTLAEVLYGAGSKVVWLIALLTALDKVGINPIPALTLAGLGSVAVGFGAQNLVRDLISGFYIVLEDQFAVGDFIQVAGNVGRVEYLTLRRTVLRDAQGALVTIANGEIRMVGNLSRDWSQAFVDISLSPDTPLEKTLPAVEAAASQLRADPAWSQALMDGPKILGVEQLDSSVSRLRLQVRTAPTRQDEVARELRRRIQMEFQRRSLSFSSVQRIEVASPSPLLEKAMDSGTRN